MQTIKLVVTSAKFIPAERRDATRSRIHVFVEDGASRDFYAQDMAKRKAAYRATFAKFLAPGTEITWSQKAGCSCGCSPGFVLDRGHSFREDGKVANLYIDTRAVSKEVR